MQWTKPTKQKFANTTVYLRGSKLLITGKTLYDITLEQGIFDNNSDFFEELYGIKPILKQKKEFLIRLTVDIIDKIDMTNINAFEQLDKYKFLDRRTLCQKIII